jgi:2-isopropylmalate synthase
VRVLIESSDGKHNWTTLGVSSDIIDASRFALTYAIEYKLNVIRDNAGGVFPVISPEKT